MEYTQAFLDARVNEEKRYVFERFTRDDAKMLGDMLYETSLDYERPVAIEITVNGLCVYRFFPEGTSLHNEVWLRAKEKTVHRMGMSSLRLAAQLALKHSAPEDEKLDNVTYCACGGGFPLVLRNGGLVGSICVSGLPHLQDHQVIIDTLKKYWAL